MLTDVEIANIETICGQEPDYEICKNHNLRVKNLNRKDLVIAKELKKFICNSDVLIATDSDVVVFYK